MENSSLSNNLNSTHYGKIQFLRMGHGYIRTKNKVNGVRDITFYYDTLSSELKECLSLGTLVKFNVSADSNGKFFAVDIELDSSKDASPPQEMKSSFSSLSLSSLDISSISDDDPDSSCSSRRNSCSSVLRTPASMQQYYLSKYSEQERKHKELCVNVDHFLNAVYSRNFDQRYSSCWLY